MLEFQTLGFHCGIDEAGRGPWAGPVVAAAVILPDDYNITVLGDSKKVSKNKREVIFSQLNSKAVIGIGFSHSEEIDRINILQATFAAMKRAYKSLAVKVDYAIIDGNRLPIDFPCPTKSIIRADAKVASVAAASIVAKVVRDKYMTKLAKKYPNYGWEKNFGYGVKYHMEALKKHGITSEHRHSFKPIHNMLC